MDIIKQRGITRHGSGIRIRYRAKGFEIDETLSLDYTQSNVDEAARILRKKIQAKRREGSRSAAIRLDDYLQMWLNTKTYRPGSRKKAVGHINNYWLPDLGAMYLDEITNADVVHAALRSKGLAAKTRTNILSTLSSAFTDAMDDGLIQSNPCVGINYYRRTDKKRADPDPFTLGERDALLAALEGQPCYIYWAIRFHTGTRPAETIALRWSDYDGEFLTVDKQIENGVVVNYTKTTEEGAPGRRVYVIKRLRSILASHVRHLNNDHIAVNQYGNAYASSEELNRPFLKAMKALGIRYRSPYNARHTRATEMLELEIPDSVAAAELGHSIATFGKVYAKWTNLERKRKSFAKMEQEL